MKKITDLDKIKYLEQRLGIDSKSISWEVRLDILKKRKERKAKKKAKIPNRNYKDYINSSDWKNKKEEKLKKSNGLCQVCGRKRFLILHHRSYSRVGNEKDNQLVLICEECHHDIHFDGDKKLSLSHVSLFKRERSLRKKYKKLNKDKNIHFAKKSVLYVYEV